jgi:hypothetical protein
MPALAHELARLIGPFHGVSLRWSRRNAGISGDAPRHARPQTTGPPVSKIVAAYRGIWRLSSMRPVAGAPLQPFIFCLIYQTDKARLGMARAAFRGFLPTFAGNVSFITQSISNPAIFRVGALARQRVGMRGYPRDRRADLDGRNA